MRPRRGNFAPAEVSAMSTDLGVLILRLVVGLLFVGHGAQKLFGWFGGFGLEGTAGWLSSMIRSWVSCSGTQITVCGCRSACCVQRGTISA